MNQLPPSRAGDGGGATTSDGEMQVLLLGLGAEIFAIDTIAVREIIDPVPVTRVAGARPFLQSIVNVRGNIIPLADLRLRFGIPQVADTPETRFVVLEIECDGDPVTVGIIADRVYEVTQISTDRSQPPPRIGAQWDPDFIRFLAKWNGEFVIVPDMQVLLN